MFPPTRRLVNLYVTPELLEGLFFPSQPGVWHRTDAGLPEGAICTGRYYDHDKNQFVFQFAHESFREVGEGCAVPEFRGVEVSAFCFDSPVDAASIAVLNGLTEKQIKVAAIADKQSFFNHDGVVLPVFNLQKCVEIGDLLKNNQKPNPGLSFQRFVNPNEQKSLTYEQAVEAEADQRQVSVFREAVCTAKLTDAGSYYEQAMNAAIKACGIPAHIFDGTTAPIPPENKDRTAAIEQIVRDAETATKMPDSWAEYDAANATQGTESSATRDARLLTMFNGDCMTVNEYRNAYGLPPRAGGDVVRSAFYANPPADPDAPHIVKES